MANDGDKVTTLFAKKKNKKGVKKVMGVAILGRLRENASNSEEGDRTID